MHKNKILIKSFFFLGILFFLIFSGENISGRNKVVTFKEDSSRFPKNMVLIYAGGSQRPEYTMNRLRPYVYRIKNNQLQWLYDGFLFIEFSTKANGTTYSFVVNHNPGGKAQWMAVLTRTFEYKKGPNALELILKKLAQKGRLPPYKRKVVMSIPNPVYGDTTWGILNGERLDFNNTDDRIKADEWYVDQVLRLWGKKKYKYLNLSGFYWLRESIPNKSSAKVIGALRKYLHEKGFDFYWIPYNGGRRAGDWKELGFDIAYQQPNYFFKLSTPYRYLTGALKFAGQNKMALEMEFNNKLLTKKGYLSKYYDYIHEFRKGGVWDSLPVAFYEGGGAWYDMSKSKDTAIQRAFNALGDIIVKRDKEKIYSQ